MRGRLIGGDVAGQTLFVSGLCCAWPRRVVLSHGIRRNVYSAEPDASDMTRPVARTMDSEQLAAVAAGDGSRSAELCLPLSALPCRLCSCCPT